MVNHPKIEVARQALRQHVCLKCYMRPAGSEALPPTAARSCEPECPIFLSLPTLVRIDVQVKDETMGRYERAVRDLICQTCMATPTAGDYCVGQMTRSCPLSLYLREAIEALDKITALRRPAAIGPNRPA